MQNTPFFDPQLISDIKNYPKSSKEWKIAADTLSLHIKSAEKYLVTELASFPDIEIEVEGGSLGLITLSNKNKRFCFRENGVSEYSPLIELNLENRIKAYEKFPIFFPKLEETHEVKIEEEKAKNIPKQSLFALLKEAITKTSFIKSPNGNTTVILQELEDLRRTAPNENKGGFKENIYWLKKFASILLNWQIFRDSFYGIKDEIPEIWSKLTLSQKLKVAAVGPVVGIGAFIGAIGIAGGGSALGVPVIIVVLLILMINNSLIDFLDFLIGFTKKQLKEEPDFTTLETMFSKLFEGAVKSLFERNINIEKVDRIGSCDSVEKPCNPFQYERHVVKLLAKKFCGEGFVTKQSSDGGVDGYIICPNTQEVILIQAKMYAKKVGFPEATQYLGTLFYWRKEIEKQFKYPISKMVIACPIDFSIEARRVQGCFPNDLFFESVPFEA